MRGSGFHGGWITVVHRYPGFIAECFWTAVIGFTVNFIVAWGASFTTKGKPEEELEGMVHSLTPKAAITMWWRRPETIAGAILMAGVALGAFFA